jgi:hypothetical protein
LNGFITGCANNKLSLASVGGEAGNATLLVRIAAANYATRGSIDTLISEEGNEKCESHLGS